MKEQKTTTVLNHTPRNNNNTSGMLKIRIRFGTARWMIHLMMHTRHRMHSFEPLIRCVASSMSHCNRHVIHAIAENSNKIKFVCMFFQRFDRTSNHCLTKCRRCWRSFAMRKFRFGPFFCHRQSIACELIRNSLIGCWVGTRPIGYQHFKVSNTQRMRHYLLAVSLIGTNVNRCEFDEIGWESTNRTSIGADYRRHHKRWCHFSNR